MKKIMLSEHAIAKVSDDAKSSGHDVTTKLRLQREVIAAMGAVLLAAAFAARAQAGNACTLGQSPAGLAFDAWGNLLVASSDLGVINRFSPAWGNTLANSGFGGVYVSGSPGIARLSVDLIWLNYANYEQGTVTILNMDTGISNNIAGLHRPLGVISSGSYTYVAENQTSDVELFTWAQFENQFGNQIVLQLGELTSDGTGHEFPAPGALAFAGQNVLVATNSGTVLSYPGFNFFDAAETSNPGIGTSNPLKPAVIFQDGASGGPTGIAVDGQGNTYVSYYYTSDVVKYSPSGQKLQTITSGVSQPEGIAIEPSTGDVYVANTGTHNISMYTPGGSFMGFFEFTCQ